MQIERSDSDALVVNQLPDGSRVILDAATETVFALNATAGAAWDACGAATTLPEITSHMQHSFHPATTEELAEQAIPQLEEKKPVMVSHTSRRRFIRSLSAAIALPFVVALRCRSNGPTHITLFLVTLDRHHLHLHRRDLRRLDPRRRRHRRHPRTGSRDAQTRFTAASQRRELHCCRFRNRLRVDSEVVWIQTCNE